MLLVVVPLLEIEWPVWRQSLARSLGNFHAAFGDAVKFCLVVQGPGKARIGLEETGLLATNVEVCRREQLSVSAARNYGLDYARDIGCTSIVFHDVSLTYLPRACHFFRDHHRDGLLRCNLAFAGTDGDQSIAEPQYTVRVGKAGRGHCTYVWAYCFPLATIQAGFDERYGPGESSRYNCGEDVLFLRDYFAVNRAVTERFMPEIGVVHPPRPTDYSKHLAYAFGQGHLCRELLRREPGTATLLHALAFFGNALVRVLSLRPRSLAILKQRIAGFLD